jgi:hypothetical protein
MTTSETTAPCAKCREEIALEAERCPKCGHEPGRSIAHVAFGGVIGLAIAAIGLILLLTITAQLISGGDLPVLRAVGVFNLGWMAIAGGVLVYRRIAAAGVKTAVE